MISGTPLPWCPGGIRRYRAPSRITDTKRKEYSIVCTPVFTTKLRLGRNVVSFGGAILSYLLAKRTFSKMDKLMRHHQPVGRHVATPTKRPGGAGIATGNTQTPAPTSVMEQTRFTTTRIL